MYSRLKKGTRRMKIIFLCFFILCPYFLWSAMPLAADAATAGANTAALFCSEMLQEKNSFAEQSDEKQAVPEQKELKLYAKAALLLDASNNRVLYEKDGYEVLPMASTTKIMTAVLALEYGNLEDEVTVSKRAASMPKVHLGMREGETYKLKDLLFSLMLESHNDSAVAIAEHIGGSVEGFADMMNQKARDIGCENTWFITPNGLDATQGDKIHSTTAYDLAKIAAYAVSNDLFVALVGTKSHQFCELQSGRGFQVNNKDQFLHMMDGAIGIKTGFTNQAGYCFVGALRTQDRTLVSVVLASGWPPHKSYKWTDTKALMSMGVKDYAVKNVEKKEIPESIDVVNGTEGTVPLCMEWKELPILLADWDKVLVSVEMKEELPAPVAKGEIAGYEKVMINGQLFAMIPVETAEAVGEYTYTYCLTEIVKRYLGGSGFR